MTTAVLIIEGAIILFIIVMIVRKRRSIREEPELPEITLPEDRQLEENPPEDDAVSN